MNLIDCMVVEDKGRLCFSFDSVSVPVPPHASKVKGLTPPPAHVKLGIRPTQISVSHEPTGDEDLQAEVYVLEPLGGLSILTIKLGSNRVRIRVSAGFSAQIGDPVCVRMNPDKIRVFHASSGQRLV
jgi:ABC-type sugar transport system ATPase subunit